jgi:hypothetical protein
MESEINKTIIVSYDEVSRMRDFCCDEHGVTRDFMDWYLIDNAFFTKTGILIVENVFKDKTKYCISFDFNNPNVSLFNLYDYETQRCVSKFRFVREQNMAMQDVSIILNDFDKQYFQKKSDTFLSFRYSSQNESKNKIEKDTEKLKNTKINKDISFKGGAVKSQIKSQLKQKSKLLKQLDDTYKQLCTETCRQGVYLCYATMYYFAKNKPKEIIGKNRDSIINEGLEKQIKVTYKYSGYINIEHKIYKTTIKRPEGEAARQYGRHIEKWSVRGHYRRINGNLIWIEAHERGDGELEKRIYGTEKESEVKIIPKVFEIEKTIIVNKDAPVINKTENTFKEKVSEHFKAPFEEVLKSTKEVANLIDINKNSKSEDKSIITRIKKFIKRLIKK